MDSLFSQFTSLANMALTDKNFDPWEIEQLMKIFEQEALHAWSSMESAHNKELEEAEATMRETEAYLSSLMDSAMDEFKSFDEMEREAKGEMEGLVRASERERSKGESIGEAASSASKKYMEAALISATASFKSACSVSSKVHPH